MEILLLTTPNFKLLFIYCNTRCPRVQKIDQKDTEIPKDDAGLQTHLNYFVRISKKALALDFDDLEKLVRRRKWWKFEIMFIEDWKREVL